MINKLLAAVSLITSIQCLGQQKNNEHGSGWINATPPVAATELHQRIMYSDTVTDNYYWMIDYFKHGADSTKVVDYLKAENAYLDTMMSGTKELQQKLFDEMKARIREQDESVPYFKNGYYYYTRTENGKQYYKFCRKVGPNV